VVRMFIVHVWSGKIVHRSILGRLPIWLGRLWPLYGVN
jgi:hypothetical protein